MATQTTGDHPPRVSAQTAERKKLNHERPARACRLSHSETELNWYNVDADWVRGSLWFLPPEIASPSRGNYAGAEARTYSVRCERGNTLEPT